MDSPAPRLPVTARVEADPYAPYAVLAVVAATVAGLFGAYLAARIVMAFWGGEPFLQPVILAGPVAILVLAYAARRQIVTSEGTRAGLPLVNFAWWVAVLGGAGYAAYLVGVQYSVRADAGNAFTAWSDNLKDVDVTDPKNPGFFKAFDGTLDPTEQGQTRVADADRIFRESRKIQAFGFRQSDIVRVAARNRGAIAFEAGGLESWEQDAGVLRCKLAVKVRTAEGDFSGTIGLTAKPVDGVRQWSVGLRGNEPNLNSFLVTRYGQAVLDLYGSAYQIVNEAYVPLLAGPGTRPLALGEMRKPFLKQINLAPGLGTRMALASGAANLFPEPADYTDQIGGFFAPADKVDSVKEAELRRAFVAAWKTGRIAPSPRITQSNPDQTAILLFPPGAVEMRFPMEIQPPGIEGGTSACRGTLVLRVDDPKFVADLEVLRTAGATDPRSEAQVLPVPVGKVPWRALRMESDMKVLSFDRGANAQSIGPGGPPGPGGPGH